MILSRRGVEMLMESGCHCSSDDSPDDMWLGMCFRNMGIPTLHNPGFHQVSTANNTFFSVHTKQIPNLFQNAMNM